ncbi:MAG: hypothetical protein KKA60_03200 [Proteobacteria bacterium]|nr:hypothetical protein [Pseudomonadota bacterium]
MELSGKARLLQQNMPKSILFIHGRNWKPPEQDLVSLWREALHHGLLRDYPAAARRLEKTRSAMAYYGDLSNAFLEQNTGKSVPDELADRQMTLGRLKRYRSDEFTEKNFRQLPDLARYGEAITQGMGTLAQFLRLGRPMVERLAPDMREYWNQDSDFGTEVRHRVVQALKTTMERNDRLLVISHSLGAVVAYDAFWKLSRTVEYREQYGDRKVDLWITLGSPLANATARRHLKGYHASGARQYPSCVNRWINVRAEDDYIAGERDCAEEFSEMKEHGLVEDIQDFTIYNLAVRQGRSNPHCSLGYLIHPAVSLAVADWV